MNKIITEIFAFVATEKDGQEGVIGMRTPDGWMPLIGADMERVESIRQIATEISKMSKTKIRLLKFKLVSDEIILESK